MGCFAIDEFTSLSVCTLYSVWQWDAGEWIRRDWKGSSVCFRFCAGETCGHVCLLSDVLSCNLTNSVALVHVRTIPTERPPHVGVVNANFSGYRSVAWSARGSPRPYSRFSWPEMYSSLELKIPLLSWLQWRTYCAERGGGVRSESRTLGAFRPFF
jgi:hypothetical protein